MYIVWQILNIVCLLVVIVYAIKSIHNFKKHKVRSVSYLVITFVLLLISQLLSDTNKEKIVLNTMSKTEENTASIAENTLLKTTLFEVQSQLTYIENDTENIPVEVTTLFKGFDYGYNFHLKTFSVSKSDNETLAYTATGILDWKILGLSFYEQTKEFKGTLSFSKP